MNKTGSILLWIGVAIVAALTLVWVFPRAYPLFPTQWEISRNEAEVIALERLNALGELPENPYILTRLDDHTLLEPHLQSLLDRYPAETVRQSHLARELLAWQVSVYARDASSSDWRYRALITPAGDVAALQLRVPPEEEGGVIEGAEARRQADAFLRAEGVSLEGFDEPEVRTQQLQNRTDTFLRYRDREALLGDDQPYGVEVTFAGDQLAGFASYRDDPQRQEILATLQVPTLLQQIWVFAALLLLPLVAIPFVRKYHAGEIGVRRGLQVGVVVLGAGILVMLFCGAVAGAGYSIGTLTRPQVTWVVGMQMIVLFFLPMALVSLLSWSVGESYFREKWGRKLAALDALFNGDFFNSTFARASLRGVAAGLALLAVLWSLGWLFAGWGVWPSTSFLLGPWWESVAWFSIPLLAFGIAFALYAGLFGRLFLVALSVRLVGVRLGPVLAALLGGFLFFPLLHVFPYAWSVIFWLIPSAIFVFLLMRYGIYTALLADLTACVVQGALPFAAANDPSIRLQASLALFALAVPVVISARHLLSDKRFFYQYEDIPLHVRRIAERERQKVELETARRIQSSILPELPPEVHGVQMAHAYLPATEVGGDFYDVLALEDGRLAVAVGDVAGHGVSSGLVMSMAKSALAVQVTFDPEVEAVFGTLNRMIYQSARKRLLTTLCYALIDPQKREMFYASAGHLFPYRIPRQGRAVALESVSYPLGVREEIDVRVRAEKLEVGDRLFLFSDGVVEGRAPNSDELFGFDRLEASLNRHAQKGVHGLRDGVLEDLREFTGNATPEDDLTVLVLQIP